MRKLVEIYGGIQYVWLHFDRYALCFMAPAIIPWLYENWLYFAQKTRIPNIIIVCSGVALLFYEMQFLQTHSNKRTNAHKLCQQTYFLNKQQLKIERFPFRSNEYFVWKVLFFYTSIVHFKDDYLFISMPISILALIYLYTCRLQCEMLHPNQNQ